MTAPLNQVQWRSDSAGQALGALAHTGIACLDDDDVTTEAPATGVSLRRFATDTGFLCLRARPAVHTELSAALQQVLGLPLAERLTRVYPTNAPESGTAIRWMSPDEWLISAPVASLFDIESALRQRLERGFAIVNVSGNQVGLLLAGPDARAVLMKSTGYDVHPAQLPPGKVVNTTFGKAGVTLACLAPDRYEILVRRSFADYLWLWLQNAAIEYGLDIGTRTLHAGAIRA